MLKKNGQNEKYKISREEHSAILRRYQREKEKNQGANGLDWKGPELSSRPSAAEAAGMRLLAADKTSFAPGEPPYLVLEKSKGQITVEQELQYSQPKELVVSARIRLTTAVRGRSSLSGCGQAGYLFRLEILSLSPGARVEGFTLGLWQMKNLCLEAGSIVCPDILWAAFQPSPSRLQGRFLLADEAKHRLLDLPWKTEGLMPGYEPFPA